MVIYEQKIIIMKTLKPGQYYTLIVKAGYQLLDFCQIMKNFLSFFPLKKNMWIEFQFYYKSKSY